MNAITCYDFTSFETEDLNNVFSFMKDFCKKWCFQMEECPTSGKKHLQGRFSLGTKRRMSSLKEVLKEFPALTNCHLSPTSTGNQTNTFYVTKPETRILGPWSDKDQEEVYIPRQVREIGDLYPWQKQVLTLSKQWDTRKIYVISPHGNIGKSTLCAYMDVYGYGLEIPFCNDYRDIMRMVMDMPDTRSYLIDMPRAIKKDKLFQMWSAIESVKNGYVFDDRYKFKRKRFDCPQVFVFTNQKEKDLREADLLTNDRWVFLEVNPETMDFYGAAL